MHAHAYHAVPRHAYKVVLNDGLAEYGIQNGVVGYTPCHRSFLKIHIKIQKKIQVTKKLKKTSKRVN